MIPTDPPDTPVQHRSHRLDLGRWTGDIARSARLQARHALRVDVDLDPAQPRLTPELETQMLALLDDWYERIEAARAAYDAGELEGKGRHLAALEAVSMSEREQAAALVLFAGLASMLAGLALKAWTATQRVPFEDVLGEAYPAFLRALASFDRSRGHRLSTWVYVDSRQHFHRACYQPEEYLLYDDLTDPDGRPFDAPDPDDAAQPDYGIDAPDAATEATLTGIAARIARTATPDLTGDYEADRDAIALRELERRLFDGIDHDPRTSS